MSNRLNLHIVSNIAATYGLSDVIAAAHSEREALDLACNQASGNHTEINDANRVQVKHIGFAIKSTTEPSVIDSLRSE